MREQMNAGLKVGVTALGIAAASYFAFKFVSKGLKGEEGYQVWALFRDAGGLVDKSRVQVAGLTIGEIGRRRLQGSYARVDIKVKPDTVLWSNATIYKKSASLLGEFFLDIDPGTPESPDPLTQKMMPNQLINGCVEATHREDCNQIKNVVEAITTTEVLTQINETLPVLRDILKDVQHLTQGPLQDIAREVQGGITKNAEAAERLLKHIDLIAADVEKVTSGPANQDLHKALSNVVVITEDVKKLLGTGEGQVNSTADKIKGQLDRISTTLDKFNHALDDVARVADNVAEGHGTVGRLLKDDTIADNVTNITEDASSFVRSLTRLQTIVGIREEWNIYANSYKTYLSLRLQPRPDKYYLVELVDDPRGSRSYSHTLTATGNPPALTNTDTWERKSSLRFSFMFAKRVQAGPLGLTGRLGIKESTGGVGVDIDFPLLHSSWLRGMLLHFDAFDFVAADRPRLKVMAALEFFRNLWLVGGVDDLLNEQTTTLGPAGITCGPASPASWCRGGRDFFVGAMLTFNDEDLRALLTIGSGALSSAGSK